MAAIVNASSSISMDDLIVATITAYTNQSSNLVHFITQPTHHLLLEDSQVLFQCRLSRIKPLLDRTHAAEIPGLRSYLPRSSTLDAPLAREIPLPP
jgi:hypothetical protein